MWPTIAPIWAKGPSFPIARQAETPRLLPRIFTIKVLKPIN